MMRAILIAGALAFANAGQLGHANAQIPQVAGVLSAGERAAYGDVFRALHAGDYDTVTKLLEAQPEGALTAVAKAELLAASASRDPAAIQALLTTAPELPEAPALARQAGLTAALPPQHALVRLSGPSKRGASRPSGACAALAAQVQPLLKAGDTASAEALVEAAAATLAPEALTEWRQRVAWAYFQQGNDADARRVATVAQAGAGDWAVDAAWVNGLASWRAGDPKTALDAFARAASNATDAETRAAGLFWAARSARAAGDTATADLRLQAAAQLPESFYGMLAAASLGQAPVPLPAPAADQAALMAHPNLRAAAALAEIGETALADQFVRYQARIGPPAEHVALIGFAAQLGLPATQVWLAQNAPAGVKIGASARYPLPGWAPAQGWRVEPALVYAHALQESELRPDATSHSGARGLMQIMPGTAALIDRHRGLAAGALTDPAANLEYGQSYLEELAQQGGTGGLLPKVIAAYNAGPNNVARWTTAQDDPLLFIESIPFAQTRAYVAIVLRNYWIYQRQAGAPTTSLTQLAAGKWPRFPSRPTQMASSGAGVYAPN